jgi:ATP-binding cassette, subfamily C, bacterial
MKSKPLGADQGVLRIFARTSLARRIAVLGCLVLSSLAEAFGLASALPLIAIAAGGGSSTNSAAENAVLSILQQIDPAASSNIYLLASMVLLGFVLKAVLNLAAMSYVGYVVAEVATSFRTRLIDALLAARWNYFTRQPVGRFTNAIANDAARGAEAYLYVATTLSVTIQLTMYLVLALFVSWEVLVTALLLGLAMSLSVTWLVRATRRAGRKQTRQTRALVSRLGDTLTGLKPLKAMARHVQIARLFEQDVSKVHRALRRQVLSKQALRNLQDVIQAVFMVAAFVIAVTIWRLPITEIFVLAVILQKTSTQFGRVQQSYQEAQQRESAYWAMEDVIAEAVAAHEPRGADGVPTLDRGCRFDEVSFAYGDKPVLEEVSLFIPAGRVTTITGHSGAGKTTVADLLLGLYRPAAGSIAVDDMPLEAIDFERWRGMVGYVPQDVILLHDSIAMNVSLGDPAFGPDAVEAALKAAGAWEFVTTLPEGMESIVGERGTLFSGGQRQRIAVARALVHRPKLLILDEATSALDPATEAAICENLRQLSRDTGLTILAISHQPAWVAAADHVYRLADRRIAEPDLRPAAIRAS